MLRAGRVVLASGVVIVAGLGLSSAATFGPVTSARLNGFTGSGPSGAPTVYASDNFTGTAGATLNGRSLVIGRTWFTPAGAWHLIAGQTEVKGVPQGRAVTMTDFANVRIFATIADSGQGGRTSGVVLRSDASASTYLSAYSQAGSGGRINLAKRIGNSATTLASFTGVVFTNPATFVVEANGPVVKVSYNGTVYITHTMTAADHATFGALSGHGMLNDNAATVRYDDFRVESL